MLKLKSMITQKSTWAGIVAIITSLGGVLTSTVDLQTAASGIIGGLILIFMPEFQKPEPPK